MTHHSLYRTRRALGPVLLLAALAAAGCDERTLSWTYASDAPPALAGNRRVALVARIPLTSSVVAGSVNQEELVNTFAGELMQMGYRVVVLREEPFRVPKAACKEKLTAEAAEKPKATIERSVEIGGADMTARYKAAQDANADLLMEVSVQATRQTKSTMWSNPIPFAPAYHTTEWQTKIRQVSVCVSAPASQEALATVTVRYRSPTDKLAHAVEDACLGLRWARDGRAPGRAKLTGRPARVADDSD